MIFVVGLIIGCLLGVAFMCLMFLAKEADKHLDYVPQAPRLKDEDQITLRDQLQKVREELHEAVDALDDHQRMAALYGKDRYEHFVEECADTLHASQVLYRIACEYGGVSSRRIWTEVVQKNQKRGLYA